MKTWVIIILFFVALVVDGIILPAVFGFKEGLLSVIYILAVILFLGTNFRGIVLSAGLSIFLEFIWGLSFGMLVLPLLVSVALFLLLNNFLYIRNRFITLIMGLAMFLVFWQAAVLVSKIST